MAEKDSSEDLIPNPAKIDKEEPNAEDNKEDENSAKDSTSQPAKKKRVADRQITKDDDDNDGNDGESTDNGSFRKADASVLAKRKILRVKRKSDGTPLTSSAPKAIVPVNGTSKPTEEKEKKSNPFAATNLLAGGKDISDSTTSAPKVFGASTSFTGFQTSISSKAAPAFNFGSSFSSSSSGFGTSNKDSTGEKSSATTTTAPTSSPPKWNFSFGKSASSSTATDSSSTQATGFGAFGSSTAAKPFSFGAGASTATASTISTTGAVLKLPENVKLTTGEEEESVIFENRCKTHKLVNLDHINPAAADSSSSTTNNSIKQQSVPPSASSITNSNKNDSDTASKENDASEKEIETSEKTLENKESITSNDSNNEEKKSKESEEKPSIAKEGKNKEQKTKWQEIGIGPLRLLRNKTNKEQLRLVQRRESVPHGTATKVIVNMFLWKESKIHRPSEKHVQVTTLAAGKKSETYLFKFKLQREASDLEKCLKEELETAQSISVKS